MLDTPGLTHSVWWQQQGFITDGFNLAAEKRETSVLQSQVIYRLMENNARIRTVGDLSSLTFRIVLVRNPKFHNRNHKIPQLNLIKLLLRIREINYTYLFSCTSLTVGSGKSHLAFARRNSD
jgi:hypothetical protein